MSIILRLIILIVIIAVIIFFGIQWWYSATRPTQNNDVVDNTQDKNDQPPEPTKRVDLPKATSNTALDNDLATIDIHLQGLTDDSVNVDQSLVQ
jgi:cytoskeletal protein RodZ